MQAQTSISQQQQIDTADVRAVSVHAARTPEVRCHAMPDAPSGTPAIELSEADLDVASGGLVVNAIIAVLVQPLLPSQHGDMSQDQARQVAAGNPMPRPR